MNGRHKKRNQSTLWRHRFWEHLIRDEADFNRHIDYIHWNPVKHGCVAQVSHWPYSSFNRYVKQSSTYPFAIGIADVSGERRIAPRLRINPQ